MERPDTGESSECLDYIVIDLLDRWGIICSDFYKIIPQSEDAVVGVNSPTRESMFVSGINSDCQADLSVKQYGDGNEPVREGC